MIGKVTTWHMTEEQRLAYIAKYPIIPKEKPKGSSYSILPSHGEHVTKEQRYRERVMDSVNKGELHKKFLAGEKIADIAKAFHISVTTLESYIRMQRKENPEDWPYRTRGRG
ncbi:hypothetical protein [Metabacillus litoralis]|uniref:hypothetical protein n=1 Tax=Metabacillus litoralis TaxID=152268 RepID=UPI00203FCFE1|nr:hypothetical protein [Metabacillus litoralis]MCM3413559.1 hypothetical protein [Metabacillus litoralis]